MLGTEAGLNLFEVMMFSFSVIAGAAQFTALQLMQENAPTVIVLLSALAVNLRVAMYSAAITPYLGDGPLWKRAIASYMLVDQSYALSQEQFEKAPDMTGAERYAYYFGSCTLPIITWFGSSFAGAALGTALPQGFPAGFRTAHRIPVYGGADDAQYSASGGSGGGHRCGTACSPYPLFTRADRGGHGGHGSRGTIRSVDRQKGSA